MKKTKYYYGIDGGLINEEITKAFRLNQNDIKYIKPTKQNVYDFVGFVFYDNNVLSIFPKRYYSSIEIDKLNSLNEYDEAISILYNTIMMYLKNASSATAERYMGFKENFESDYPFADFYKIYDYYQKYGLYKEEDAKIVTNQKGKISWKTTINKAQKIIFNDNLFFVPLYVKKNDYQNVFVTDCMAFIIDTTIDMFSMFINLKKTGNRKTNFDYFKNINYVVSQLRTAEKRNNKDINKKLINSMISFFETYKNNASGGNIHIKINYFDMVWQDIMNNYLNKCFNGMDNVSKSIILDLSQSTSKIKFKEQKFIIDKSTHKYYIMTDHFATDENNMYIFDSKYYQEINQLNYKQFSYNELLRYINEGKQIYSALLLPGEEEPKIHFEFADNYVGPRETGLYIIEQYISPRDAMKKYIE